MEYNVVGDMALCKYKKRDFRVLLSAYTPKDKGKENKEFSHFSFLL